jgi:hypothetical protein
MATKRTSRHQFGRMDKPPIGRAPNESPELQKAIQEMRAANEFLEQNRGREIVVADDPRIYVLDQYIKQILEIFVNTQAHGLKQLIAACGGSPLSALIAMWAQSAREKPKDAFLQLGLARLLESAELKRVYLKGTYNERMRAGAALRMRGLMR